MEIKNLTKNTFEVRVACKANVDDERDPRQPFRNLFSNAVYTATLSETEDLTPPAEIVYRKRGGGVYIYSENLKTITYAMGQILAAGVARTGAAAAVSVCMLLVPLTIFIISQSNIIETMASSGVKE